MKKVILTVNFNEGLHARPAVKLVKLASSFRCQTLICKGDDQYDAKSMVSVLSACITCGQDFTLCVDGEDEDEAFSSLTKFFEEG